MPDMPAPVVVFDAYGTLVENPQPTHPFRRLKKALEQAGVDTSDYARRAMAERHSLVSLASSYGSDLPVKVLAELEHDLMQELLVVRPFSDAQRTVRHVLSQGAMVVIASNLAWPYALPVKHIVRGIMGDLEMRLDVGRVRLAFSFDLGSLKPDPGFFQAITRSFDAPSPRRFFMVGDRLEDDVQGPIRAGWQAWHLDRTAQAGLLDAPWDEWLG